MARNPHIAAALQALENGDIAAARQEAAAGIKANPGSSELQHLAGLIECRAGEPARGIPFLRRAAAAVPESVPFRVMLVRALVDSRLFEEALRESDPRTAGGRLPPPLWHARAEAADGAEDWESSAEAWGAVARSSPADWRALANAGNALARLERWVEAEQALARAAALNTEDPSIRFSHGAALARAGRADHAIAVFRRGLQLDPANLQGRVTLARLYADTGDGVAATRQLELAANNAANDPDGGPGQLMVQLNQNAAASIPVSAADVISVREIGRLFERTGQMDDLRRLLAQADDAKIGDDQLGYLRASLALSDGDSVAAQRHLEAEDPAADPVRWHRLASRVADRLKDSAQAFAQAHRMNRSFADYEDWRRRGAAYRANIRDLAAYYDRAFVHRFARIPPWGRRSPAFLCGFPRSGTTLLDTFLMGHPEVRVLEEVHMLGPAEKVIGNVRALPQASGETLARAREAYLRVLDEHAEPGFDGLVIDKMPMNMVGLPLLHALFPDARIIFAQRHPADCVLSGFMQAFTLNDPMASFLDIADAADLYDAAMTAFTRGRDALPVPVHTLVYEQLVADPASALRPVVDFLGLDWDEALLDHQSTARTRGVIVTPSYDQVTRPLDAASSGRWERYRDQMASILPLLLEWADRLGYRPSAGENSQQSDVSTAS